MDVVAGLVKKLEIDCCFLPVALACEEFCAKTMMAPISNDHDYIDPKYPPRMFGSSNIFSIGENVRDEKFGAATKVVKRVYDHAPIFKVRGKDSLNG